MHDAEQYVKLRTGQTAGSVADAAPPADSVFEPVVDRYGGRLALVFGNHFPGGHCPFFVGSRCHHCDIGGGEGVAFTVEHNQRRLAWFQAHYAARWNDIRHLVLYNSGSVLNPREMPFEVLQQILSFASTIPQLRAVSLDSREAFIRRDMIARIAESLPADVVTRPILGLETSNDRLRNNLLEKQMPFSAVERAFHEVASAAQQLGQNRVGMDVNVVVGGPGTTVDSAVDDATTTATVAFTLGRRFGTAVDLNLHAYYPSARGLERFPAQRRCSVPTLAAAAIQIAHLAKSESQAGIFIGWQDEGHDVEHNLRERELSHAKRSMDQFNRTQNPDDLQQLL